MPANQDYKDLFKLLLDEKVSYLIVGAHAVVFYTEPRYTKDMDILVQPSEENAKRVYKVLMQFGAPLKNITVKDFIDPDMIYQIGIEPNRIDILMSIKGVCFDDAWENRIQSSYDGIPISIISKSDLINAKTASGRPQDLIDLDNLKNISNN